MTDQNPIRRALADFASDSSLLRASGSYYGHTDEVVTVVDLQKSQYGDSYFVNIGFFIIDAEHDLPAKPKHNRAHIWVRLGSLDTHEVYGVDELLDLERSHEVADHRQAVRTMLDALLTPVLGAASSVAGLKALHEGGALARARMSKVARDRFRTID